jgi:outer membrane protein assembly factor BamA
MNYYWLRFHNVLSHKVNKNIYCGIGYQFDYHFNIVDFGLHIKKDTLFNTPNYSYSALHGYNPAHYISSGLSANFVFDTRDDMVNAYHGVYINVNYQYNFSWLGSSVNGSELWTEFRTYVQAFKTLSSASYWPFGTMVVL